MLHHTASVAFWTAATVLFLTYAGYALLMAGLARTRGKRPPKHGPELVAPASIVLVVRDEAERILARLRNLCESEYPRELLEIVVASDGSTDAIRERVIHFGDSRVRLIETMERRGKAAGVNAGVAAATGEVVIFADARQSFLPTTVAALVKEFADPSVGAVTGEMLIAQSGAGKGAGLDLYWLIERWLRRSEAEFDSCIGCTGAVYAIRRNLFAPIPEDTIVDDVVIPMNVALQGHRVAYARDAVAIDPQPLVPELEKWRKRRTLAGNFQMLFRNPAWLLPWRNRLWWQLICHKYLRLAGPLMLGILMASNAVLLEHAFYRWTMGLQLGFYALAVVGMIVRNRLFGVPAAFVFLNVAVVRGFWDYLAGRHAGGWAQTPRQGK